MTRSSLDPVVNVRLIPNKDFEFEVEFDFNGASSIPMFEVEVKINPELSNFFNEDDMKQLLQFTVDTGSFSMTDSVLKLSDFGTTVNLRA